MLRYQVITIVAYLAGTVWLVRELASQVDEDDHSYIKDPWVRYPSYFAFAMVTWLPLFLYFVWLWVRGVVISLVLGFAKIAHHLSLLYRLSKLLRAGVTIVTCPCPACAARARRAS